MPTGLRKRLSISVALFVVLQISWITVLPAHSYDGRWVRAESSIAKPMGSCFAPARLSKNAGPWFAPTKIPGLSGITLSAASLRFDLKQNLCTWPVLSNGQSRSPPAHFAR